MEEQGSRAEQAEPGRAPARHTGELQVRQLLNRIPAAAYTCDADGLITYFNSQALELWGRSPKLHDSVDRYCGSFRLFAPDGSPIAHEECGMALALRTGNESNGEEIVIERPDGRRVTALAHASPIRDEVGRISGAVNVLVDISDRKQAELAQSRLAAIVASSDDAIISKDLDGTILSWNKAAERMFGHTAEEAIGRTITLIIPEERLSEEGEILERLRRGDRVDHYETIRVAKDGRRLNISLTSSPVHDRTGRIVGASKVARDITARKESEQALADATAEVAAQVAKLQAADRAKNDFLATLAHELRNPLAPIRNAVEVLHRSPAPTPELQWGLGVIDRQMRQMVRLIDDLLDLSRISLNRLELRRERIEIIDVLRTAVETSRPLIAASAQELTVTLPPERIWVRGDLTRLAQVLSNLLNNACKYTNGGGHIWLTAERDGTDVAVRVRDTGIGIRPDMLSRIFDMFTQGHQSIDQARGGLGIGLTVVRQLVALHQGTVTAASDGPGKGSEFTVRLPISPDVAVDGPAQAETVRPAATTGGLRVLIVDDNAESADSLGILLGMSGFEVRTAYDGLEAVAAAADFRPDVALLDIGLPKLNGHEVARRIRREPWGAGILLVAGTGWGDEAAKAESRKAGFDHHLVKPMDPAALVLMLSSLEQGRRPLPVRRDLDHRTT